MYGCPRSRKKFFERLDHVIGCSHVLGLLMRPDMAAGRYGDTRTWRKSIERAFELYGSKCVSGPGSDRSFDLTVRRPPHAPDFPLATTSDRRSGHRNHRNPEIFSLRQHGPDRARHFVGERDRRQLLWFARQHAL